MICKIEFVEKTKNDSIAKAEQKYQENYDKVGIDDLKEELEYNMFEQDFI